LSKADVRPPQFCRGWRPMRTTRLARLRKRRGWCSRIEEAGLKTARLVFANRGGWAVDRPNLLDCEIG
jgi:hypothetical protein